MREFIIRSSRVIQNLSVEFNYGQETDGGEWVQRIAVLAPVPRSTIQEDTRVTFKAPGMTLAQALCWQQPTDDDANVAVMAIDPEGGGQFTFPASDFPHGPTTILWAQAPCYFECHFTTQSVPGTWPAFWTLTHIDRGVPSDELDIAECYGGVGKGNPNHPGYSIVSHFWRHQRLENRSRTVRPRLRPVHRLGAGPCQWEDRLLPAAIEGGQT